MHFNGSNDTEIMLLLDLIPWNKNLKSKVDLAAQF